MEKKRALARKRKQMQQEKITSYSKATLKDKLRDRRVFHVTFEHSFLFTLLNAGGHER